MNILSVDFLNLDCDLETYFFLKFKKHKFFKIAVFFASDLHSPHFFPAFDLSCDIGCGNGCVYQTSWCCSRVVVCTIMSTFFPTFIFLDQLVVFSIQIFYSPTSSTSQALYILFSCFFLLLYSTMYIYLLFLSLARCL